MLSSEESLKKIKKSLNNFSKENIIEKYKNREYLIGTFQENKYKIFRKFIKNKYNKKELYYTVLRPKKQKKRIAQLIMIHGLLDSSMLIEMASVLADNYVTVHLFDLSGSGFSEGCLNNEEIKDNLKDIASIISKIDDNLPTFLYGHSVGGLLAMIFMTLNKDFHLNGILLSSPVINIPKERKLTLIKKVLFTRHSGRILYPFLINNNVNTSQLSRLNQITQYFCLKKETAFFGFFKKYEKNYFNFVSYKIFKVQFHFYGNSYSYDIRERRQLLQ